MQNNPYIGPRPFERVDRVNFYGRTRETRDLLSLIMAERVVLFYAQSGAGKTSLLNTQIIPALENEGFSVLPVVRVGSDLPPGVPASMIKNIFVFSVWMGLVGKEMSLSTLAGANLSSTLNLGLADAPRDEETGELKPPILIIDQFEEILTTHRDRWQDARGFFEQLAEALEKTPKLGVVLAMREDHVASLDPYAALLPRRLKARFRMEQLKIDGALEAIKKPAQYAGHPFASGVAEILANNLSQVHLVRGENDPKGQDSVSGQYIEPVQLQVVCRRLWDDLPDQPVGYNISAEDVEKFGNVDLALTGFYQSALQQTLEQAKLQGWKARESQLRRWFSTQLITPMQTRGLVMRGPADTGDLPNPVVDFLESRHLIRADVRAGARWYEISHDRLLEPILRSNAEWALTSQSSLHRAAQLWQDSGREEGLLYSGKVLAEAQAWANANPADCDPIDLKFLEECQEARRAAEKEQRQHRLIRRLMFAALALLLLALGASVFAWRERDRANNQALIAEEKRVEASQQRAEADIQRQEADKQRVEAEAQRAEAETQRTQAETQRLEAERLARLAVVRQLVSQASDFAARYPQRSLLLAIEALRINAGTDRALARAIEDQLREVLVTTGGVVLAQYGNRVNQVAFSANAQQLIAGSEDGLVDLWTVSSTGAEVKQTLLRQTSPVRTVAVSADGHWAAAGDAEGKVHLWDLTTKGVPQPIELGKHTGAVRALEFSPDGRWLVSGGGDGRALVWDLTVPAVAEQTPTRLNAHTGTFNALAIDADSRLLATGGADNLIKLYTLDDLAAPPITLTGHTDQVGTLAFDPLGDYLASGSTDATARLWKLKAKDVSKSSIVLPGHEEQVFRVAFSPDGQWLATGSVDTTARLWDLIQADPSQFPIVLRGHDDQVWALVFSPDSRWLFTGSRDSTIQAWDTSTADISAPSSHHQLLGHEGPVETLATSSDGRWLASGSDDKTVQLWGINIPGSAASPIVLRGHTSVVRGALIDPGMHTLATFSGDGTVRLWDIASQEPAAKPIVLPSHEQAIYAAALSSNGRWLATASQDTTSRLWDLHPPGGIITSTVLRGHTSALRAIAFTPDDRRLITGSRDGTARIWDMTRPDPSKDPIVLRGHTEQIRVLDISPDGHWLATGGDDHLPRLWDLRAASIPSSSQVLRDHTQPIRALDFSPDNRWLATGGDDRVVRVWDLRATDPTTHPLKLSGHTGTIRAIRFTPDGKWLATAAGDGSILLWNLAQFTGTVPLRPTFSLHDHTGEVRAIDISSDGHWLLSGSEDGTARLWDLTAADPGAYSQVFPGHNGPVWGVTISPNGEWFIAASQDGNARLWKPTSLDEVLQIACLTAGRNLSAEEWSDVGGGDVSKNYHRTCDQFPNGAGVK